MATVTLIKRKYTPPSVSHPTEITYIVMEGGEIHPGIIELFPYQTVKITPVVSTDDHHVYLLDAYRPCSAAEVVALIQALVDHDHQKATELSVELKLKFDRIPG